MDIMLRCFLVMMMGITLLACRSKKGEETIHGQSVTDWQQVKDMAGTWYATAGTYSYLAEKRYPRDSVYLILQPDSSFRVRLPDCMDAAAKGGNVWDAIGAWKLHRNGEAWKLGMAFEKGRLFRYRTITDFDIVLQDSVLTLVRAIGDPKKEKALQFRKDL